MDVSKTRLAILLSIALGLSTLAVAQDAITDRPDSEQTVGEYKKMAEAAVAAELPELRATMASNLEAKKVEAQPTLPGAVSVSDQQTTGSVTDFTSLFQLGIQGLSTGNDDTNLTITFNPVRLGRFGVLQAQATAVDPVPSEQLLALVDETSRATQEDRVNKELGDFDDVQWSASYSYRQPEESFTWGETTTLWGREARRYRALLDDVVAAAYNRLDYSDLDATAVELSDYEVALSRGLSPPPDAAAPDAAAPDTDGCSDPNENLEELTFGCIRTAMADGRLQDFDLDGYIAALNREARAITAFRSELSAFGLDRLPLLVANQPQLVGSLIYRDRNEMVGPNTLGGEVKLEWGSFNLNRILRQYEREDKRDSKLGDQGFDNVLLARAVHAVLESEKDHAPLRFSMSIKYMERDDYNPELAYAVTTADGGSDGEATEMKTASLSMAGSDEWCAKAQVSRYMLGQVQQLVDATAIPRIDLSAEYVDVSDDPMRQDRFVLTATYAYPLTATATLPVSLVYANHSEFLGDPDEKLSAHFGLSYKIDRKKE